LLEAELFGAARGAYSGADGERLGLVRAAHRGTLFLDEIGDLPLACQAALLRVLESQEVLPLGMTRPIAVDIAIVCATHRDLGAMMNAGIFRTDLYARIAGLEVELPPLAARREDIGLLLQRLVAAGAVPHFSALAPDAALALMRHDWPLNIRELRSALAYAAALAKDGIVRLEHLPPSLQARAVASGAVVTPVNEEDDALRSELVGHLGEHHGNVAAVARSMGKHRRQIHRWMTRFGLAVDDWRKS
jgi:transcriptional regulator of acetoin/glycerol metabolism